MNKTNILIYKLPVLFQIIKEINSNNSLKNFNFLNITDVNNLKNKNFEKYLVVCNKKYLELKKFNYLLLNKLPIKINILLEKINISLLKFQYSVQSDMLINKYSLDLNARTLKNKNDQLKLTQKETEIILFLLNNTKSVSIDNLQRNVWGYNSKLETHTVETHIYRLRKKILNKFNNQDFIMSTENGYKIKK